MVITDRFSPWEGMAEAATRRAEEARRERRRDAAAMDDPDFFWTREVGGWV